MKKTKKKNKLLLLAGGASMVALGTLVIPPVIDKCKKKVYKTSLKHEDIDFDNMGPVIEKKESEGE